jgi:hypothetical protein
MKNILFSLIITYSLTCFAQTQNPDLFQTWYLSSVATDDGSMGFTVSDITPSISPTLTIMNDFTFNGVGACNSFNGEFISINANANAIETTQFSNSTNDCGITLHNDFEIEYFTFIQWISDYTITPVENGLMMRMFTPPFGSARFFNYQLNTMEFEVRQIELFPNPTDSKIHLKSQNSPIKKVEFYSSLGKKIKTIDYKFDSMDISDFVNGIYFIRIFTNQGVYNEKIIKK